MSSQPRILDREPRRGGHRLLDTMAERVRKLRAARGWSRERLAERAGLSVRFLARVESGEGNISVIRLASLAAALDTTAAALLQPAVPAPNVVALVGMRGAGKSTVGPRLAGSLGVPFVEVDEMIVEAAGLPLDQLFELHGEGYYRRLEREAVRRILERDEPAVVAMSGGVVNEAATWEPLLDRATVVWLKARPEDHWERVIRQGDRRPMAGQPDAMEELRAMLAARERLYAQADWTFDTSGKTPEGLAAEIGRALRDGARSTDRGM